MTLALPNATLERALDAICDLRESVTFSVVSNSVWLTTKNNFDIPRVPSFRAYDIRPFRRIAEQEGVSVLLHTYWGDPLGRSTEDADERSPMVRVVEQSVALNTWTDEGGMPDFRTCEFGGVLLVTQCSHEQRAVADFLNRLAAALRARSRPDNNSDRSYAVLDRNIDVLRLHKVTISQAIDTLADKTGATIVLDWQAVLGVGAAQVPIQLELRDVPLRTAMGAVLESADPEGTLRYTSDDNGVLVVSTSEQLPTINVSRVYAIRDLIERALLSAPNRISRPGGVSVDQRVAWEDAVDSVASSIEEAVNKQTSEQDRWTSVPMREICGLLIVTAPAEIQRRVETILNDFRHQQISPSEAG